MEEALLIQQSQSGDEQAFTQLYEAYVKKIYGFILNKTFNRSTAEDLTSETFLKALHKLDSFDVNRGKFSTWLFSIARNNVIDHFRKERSHSDIEDAWDLASDEDVAGKIALALSSHQLKTCMKSLTLEQREIITMRFWQDMSYAQIAQILGKTEAGIKMNVSRSIKKLRNVMPEFLTLFISLSSLS